MTIDDMINKIEKNTDIRVLDIYECNESIYIAECINSITKSMIGDFYYTVSKDQNDFRCFNPAENPGEFIKLMKNKKKVYTSKETYKLLSRSGFTNKQSRGD